MIPDFNLLGFSNQDVCLLWLCPFFAMLGSIMHGGLLENNLEVYPKAKRKFTDYINLAIVSWWLSKLCAGLLTGIVVGLLFVGSIKEGPGHLCRVLALAMAAGYSAHKVWATQEKFTLSLIDKRVKEILKN